jgi:hypothetical protein
MPTGKERGRGEGKSCTPSKDFENLVIKMQFNTKIKESQPPEIFSQPPTPSKEF